MTASCLANLGELAWEQGHLEEANTYYSEALGAYTDLADTHQIAILLANVAKLRLSQGDPRGAIEHLRDGLELLRWLPGEKWVVGGLLRLCAQALSAAGTPDTGAVLWGASNEVLREVGYVPSPGERALEERIIEAARTELTDRHWNEAVRRGEAMSMEEVLHFALAQKATSR